MSLYTASINSGSNGNCYYISNGKDALLIDAGLSCRETEIRMKKMGLAIGKVRALFITHEHTDHIKGAQLLSSRYKIPVYLNHKTHYTSHLKFKPELYRRIEQAEVIDVHGMTVTGFSKLHDAADPISFTVGYEGVNIGVYTDIGAPCDNLAHHMRQCHAAYLEANYDEEMLENGRYPQHLKDRIRGGYGHLSNKQALDFFLTHRPQHMTHLFLAHLSRDNNNPELALNLFRQHAGNVQVHVASRYGHSDVYHITADGTPATRKVQQGVLW
ncbi:MBL fold metallo-hydrolase [Chitinophagaceae bacterium IBVUCB1]|nr:MBL fold metallo-hydrolase [Chitinophagaceae bacterium IBVUCB1]